MESSSLVVVRSHRDFEFILPGLRGLFVIVEEEEFRSHFVRTCGADPTLLDGRKLLSIPPQILYRMRSEWDRLAHGTLQSPKGMSLCRAVAEALALQVPDSASGPSVDPPRWQIVREAIGMREHEEDCVTFSDVAGHLGINERTLRNWFKRQTGLAPTQFLIRRDLSRAYRELLLADPDCKTVTEIAMNCGFRELGRFAGRFFRVFGERPSDGLKRPAPRQIHRVKIGPWMLKRIAAGIQLRTCVNPIGGRSQPLGQEDLSPRLSSHN